MEFPSAQRVGPETPTLDGSVNLTEATSGLPRGKAMKQVIGPFLAEHLRGVFAASFTTEEYAALPLTKYIGNTSDLVEAAADVLSQRQQNADQGESDNLQDAQEANYLFFWNNIDDLWSDSFKSSLYIPLAVAFDTMQLESGRQTITQSIARYDPIDFDSLLEVLSRPTTDKILLHLAKGPNGFIGLADFDAAISPCFFGFINPSDKNRRLAVDDAYKVEDGKVIGLSDSYFLAAASKREKIGKQYRRDWMSRNGYHYANTSGCPVRHAFADEHGENQRPLILDAKDFLTRALLAASVRTTLALNEDMLGEIEKQNQAEERRQLACDQLDAARYAAALTYDIRL